MRTHVFLRITSIVGLLLATGATALLQQPSVTAFLDVNVIPMDAERMLPRHTVVVRGERVAAVGPATQIEVPRGATTIQGRGRNLMPGLADMHAHLPAPPTPPQETEDVLFLFLANGVTFVRGMMGDVSRLALRGSVAAGSVLGPTLYVAGPPPRGGRGS